MTPGVIHMVMVDFGGGRAAGIGRTEQTHVTAALQLQMQQHVGLPPPFGWGIGATVRAAAGPFDVHPDEWVVGLFETPDQPGELGYHDESPNGKPFSKLFPLLDKQDNQPWSVTASHEVVEMAVNPLLSRCSQGSDGTIWATEGCDQVEAQSYMLHGVPVSDWCTPANFEPPPGWQAAKLKLNWLGNLTAPMQVLPGGYAQYFDPQRGWQSVEHAEVKPRPYRQLLRQLGHGRSAMRAAAHARAAATVVP